MATLTVNGKSYTVNSASTTPLLWVLRDEIGLTGTKYGCGIEYCSARTVYMAGSPRINITIANQGSALGGIGEVGVPGVAPAIANAYAALTGTRKRSLPLGIVATPAGGD